MAMDPDDAHAQADATFGGCGRPDCPTGHLEPDPDWPLDKPDDELTTRRLRLVNPDDTA